MVCVLIQPAQIQAQLAYSTNNGAITVTRYVGPAWGSVDIPSSIYGLPVTRIEGSTFDTCTSLTSLTIPDGVTNIGSSALAVCTSLTNVIIGKGVARIGSNAFYYCPNLRSIYFKGDAPTLDGDSVFGGDFNATVYFIPGTTGWGSTFGGLPTALWLPAVRTSDPDFGVKSNRFGFTIAGTSNLIVVVEARTNLTNAIWSPVSTNTVLGGFYYFTDPGWTNFCARWYRVRLP
jgi:hypothetical protein